MFFIVHKLDIFVNSLLCILGYARGYRGGNVEREYRRERKNWSPPDEELYNGDDFGRPNNRFGGYQMDTFRAREQGSRPYESFNGPQNENFNGPPNQSFHGSLNQGSSGASNERFDRPQLQGLNGPARQYFNGPQNQRPNWPQNHGFNGSPNPNAIGQSNLYNIPADSAIMSEQPLPAR